MAEEPGTPQHASDTVWTELGLQVIGRQPRIGDLVAFPAEQKLLRVATIGPDTLTLEIVRAAPEDQAQLGTLHETSLTAYLEAWGEGTFSPPTNKRRKA